MMLKGVEHTTTSGSSSSRSELRRRFRDLASQPRGSRPSLGNYPKAGCNPRKIQDLRAFSDSYLAVVQEWTAEAGLKLHPEKRKIVDAKETSFDFLGYRFERGRRYRRTKSLTTFKDAI